MRVSVAVSPTVSLTVSLTVSHTFNRGNDKQNSEKFRYALKNRWLVTQLVKVVDGEDKDGDWGKGESEGEIVGKGESVGEDGDERTSEHPARAMFVLTV